MKQSFDPTSLLSRLYADDYSRRVLKGFDRLP
jgi:hypothetical protein